MYTIVVIGGILLIVALIGVAMWCCYRAGKDKGYDEAHAGQEAAQAAERKAELKKARYPARHAPTQPRTSLVASVGGPVDLSQSWYARNPGRRYMLAQMAGRMAAAHMVLPEPGKYKPEPARDSGAGTETFTKVDVGATGPIAKLVADNEAWNAQQAVEDEIFRLGLALD